MKYAQPGTVSHGTLRDIDLVDAFTDALEALQQQNLYTSDGDELRLVALNEHVTTVLANVEQNRTELRAGYADSEACLWDLEALTDCLEAFAPEGHYFGAHWGDGSDFGFWPSDD